MVEENMTFDPLQAKAKLQREFSGDSGTADPSIQWKNKGNEFYRNGKF